jgi:tetratricopeptide (TPR) repeat protein
MLADYYGFVRRYADARRILNGVNGQDVVLSATKTRLAALDAAQGDRAGALRQLNALVTQFPTDATARLTNARLLHLDGRRAEAVTQARVVADDENNVPAATDAQLLIGSIEAEEGHRAAAQSAFEAVLRLRPQTLEAALNLASLQFSAGNYDDAQSRAKQALAIHPGDKQARLMLVRVAVAQKDLSGARDGLLSLTRDFPTWAALWNLRASVELRSGQIDAARQAFGKAAALEPADLESLAGLIGIDLGTHHVADALARVETGLKADRPSAAFLVLAARAYTAAGQLPKAEDVLKRAISADPSGLDAYSFLGQLYVDQHRVDEARDRFQQVLKIDPRSVSAHTMLGMLLETQSKTAEAEAEYQAALRIDPHAAVAANNLAWIYADANRNIDQALQLAQTAADQLPDEPHVADTLGWAYYRKQMAAAAIRSLELSVAKDATDPGSHYHLGMAYVLSGDRARARQELQRAVASNVPFSGADEAKATLAKLGVR